MNLTAKFVSREKLSKKARKELDNQKRAVWAFSPTTKKVKSKKLYNRKKSAHAWKDDFDIIYDETNGQPQKWAMKLTYRDSFVHRRKWQLHIGIEMKDVKTAMIYYALMYCDHMAGSFSTLKPPVITPPALLLSLNQNPRIVCCSGSFQLPFGAIAIDGDNLQTALSIMCDPARELPVVLITCPDLVSPATAERMLIGNAIVCWVDDMDLLGSINAALSPQIYVEWDSIQIMLPQMAEQSQHPALALQKSHVLAAIESCRCSARLIARVYVEMIVVLLLPWTIFFGNETGNCQPAYRSA